MFEHIAAPLDRITQKQKIYNSRKLFSICRQSLPVLFPSEWLLNNLISIVPV